VTEELATPLEAVPSRPGLRQLGRIALAAGAFVGFGLGGALLSWVVLPLASLDPDRRRRRRRCQRLVGASFRFFHAYMRGAGLLDFDPRQLREPLPGEAVVVVSNHPTLVDVTAMIAAYGELCVVAKRSMFYNPLVGPLLRLCGHVPSGADGLGAPSVVLAQVRERLREGHKVLMFPEGTRSPPEGLGRFRGGPFHVAIECAVAVVPHAITASPRGLMKGQAWYAIPTTSIRLRIEQLPALSAGDFEGPRELRRAVHERISAAL